MKKVAPNKMPREYMLINEIFTSIQGEGFNVGKPVIFVRVSKCNMSCHFCDTNYQPIWFRGTHSEVFELIKKEYRRSKRSGLIKEPAVLLTGGEPTIYDLYPLLNILKEHDYWVGLESNGRNSIDEKTLSLIDHVTISPKAPKGLNQLVCEELRLVKQKWVNVDYLKFIEGIGLAADYYYISPMEIDGNFNIVDTYKLLEESRKYCFIDWRLSLQTHKLAGIR